MKSFIWSVSIATVVGASVGVLSVIDHTKLVLFIGAIVLVASFALVARTLANRTTSSLRVQLQPKHRTEVRSLDEWRNKRK